MAASAAWLDTVLVIAGRRAGAWATSAATWRIFYALVAAAMLGFAVYLARTLA